MTIHLFKMAAGIKTAQALADIQAQLHTISDPHLGDVVVHTTRNTPTRIDEILEGGSMYWVLKGAIQLRQPILDIRKHTDDEGRPFCAIYMSPELIRVMPMPQRPIQGWRYLLPERAPKDIGIVTENNAMIDDEMMRELQELGLI